MSGSGERKERILVRTNMAYRSFFKTDFFPKSASITFAEYEENLSSEEGIQLIVHICDYACRLSNCINSFAFSSQYNVPFVIVRPVLFSGLVEFSKGYFLTIFENTNIPSLKEYVVESLKNPSHYGFRNHFLHPLNPVSKIVRVEKEIIERPWENWNLSNISNFVHRCPSWISIKFREITGKSLKKFILINRYCFALYQIVFTERSIKEIAIDLDYEPLSFSKRFYSQFGIYPSHLRMKQGYDPIFRIT
jgi:AraC-like DNA-binding protein